MIKIILLILALLYAISPYDILPDFLVGWGWLDDIVILGLLFRYFQKHKRSAATHRYRFDQAYYRQGPASAETRPPKTPHEVLGVPPNAGPDEIKAAYRRLAQQYHPDKLQHLGDDFKALAEKRFKEIQEAYQALKPK